MPSPVRRNETAGLLYALAGFALLSCGDAVVKSMAGQWAPTAIAMVRYVLGAVGLSALLWRAEGAAAFRMPAPGAQLLRGFAVALATIGFFSAIFVMPLATATSITFTSPMLTALLAALVLGEPARKETLIASAVAFIGVLVVLRPNFLAAGWAALLPLLSAVGMSLLMIGNRFVAGKGSTQEEFLHTINDLVESGVGDREDDDVAGDRDVVLALVDDLRRDAGRGDDGGDGAAHVADPLMEFGYGGTRTGKSLPIMQITQAARGSLNVGFELID